MKSLFKTSGFSSDGEPAVTTVDNKKSVNEIVEQIHTEFHTASDKLVEMATEIISEEEKNKLAMLNACGFNSVPETVKLKEKELELKLTDGSRGAIAKYRVLYPAHKFISQQAVTAICEKWNLVQGSVDKFKGFVPRKNLQEISSFLEKHPLSGKLFTYGDKIINLGDNYKIRKEGTYLHIFWCGKGSDPSGREYHFQCNPDSPDRFYSHGVINGEYIDATRGPRLIRTGLQICAPLKDMNTKGMRVRNHKLEDFPDPVVLYPVAEGFIIITAWGDEASDPEVVNQQMN